MVPASMGDRFFAFAIEVVLYLVFITLWILCGWWVLDLPLIESERFTEFNSFSGGVVETGTGTTYSLGDQRWWTLGWLLYCIGFVFLEVRTGQTIGKRVLGLSVVDQSTGNRPSVSQSIVRLVFFLIGSFGLYIPTAIIIASSPLKQRTGDAVAKTRVIYKRTEG